MKYSNKYGLSLCDILGVVFIALKLMNYINWSWVWVLSPFWIAIIIKIVIACVTDKE